MRRQSLHLRLLLTATLAASAWAQPAAEANNRAGSPRLSTHVDTVPAGMRTNVVGAIDVDAPACAVWTALASCSRAPAIIPGVKSCHVLAHDEQGGRWETRELVGRHPLLPGAQTSIVHVDFDPPSLIKFTGIGGDLGKVEAEWRIEPLGSDYTRASYQGRVIAPIHAPAFVVRLVAQHDAARALTAVRRQAASIRCQPEAPTP